MFDYFVKIIENMLSDQHFLAARSALLALKTCQNEILSWTDMIPTNTVLKLFDVALATLRHSYWTVKASEKNLLEKIIRRNFSCNFLVSFIRNVVEFKFLRFAPLRVTAGFV